MFERVERKVGGAERIRLILGFDERHRKEGRRFRHAIVYINERQEEDEEDEIVEMQMPMTTWDLAYLDISFHFLLKISKCKRVFQRRA